MAATMTIELKNLRFFAHHGWHDGEARTGNEFEVQLLATFPAIEHITSLFDTIDYTEVYELTKTIFLEPEKLLETVAQKITHALETKYRNLQRIHLTITKLNPPIASFTGTVGITYIKDFR